MSEQELVAELIRAGRTIEIEPVPDDLVADVLAGIAATSPARRRHWLGWWRWLRSSRRRLVAVLLAVVLLIAALTPPVRAAVGEWLQLGGVLIRTGSPPSPAQSSPPTLAPSPPLGGHALTLEQARAAVAFPIGVPAELGPPDRITVTKDRRVVGMDWTIDGRPVHLDQFDGTMSWVFVKQNWEHITPTEVADHDAVWLADTHEITYVDRTGVERRETARLSGPSLIWQPTIDDRELTARLEGIATLDRARAVARSLR